MKETKDFVAALHAFEKARRDPELKAKALLERGVCYISTQSYDSAISELERALKVASTENAQEQLYIKYFLASCYEKKRNIDKAVDLWEQVYKERANFRDVAEKLSQYQELRTDDSVKDYLTASMDTFYKLCTQIASGMNLNVKDISDTQNGCQIIAVDAENKWRNVKKIPKLIRFLRVPEMITETTVRSLHEEMKSLNITRGILISSSNFSRKAIDFAESRPIELYNKDKLQKLLTGVKIS
jgi:tetratricopeptide (TPR) repeat protein